MALNRFCSSGHGKKDPKGDSEIIRTPTAPTPTPTPLQLRALGHRISAVSTSISKDRFNLQQSCGGESDLRTLGAQTTEACVRELLFGQGPGGEPQGGWGHIRGPQHRQCPSKTCGGLGALESLDVRTVFSVCLKSEHLA